MNPINSMIVKVLKIVQRIAKSRGVCSRRLKSPGGEIKIVQIMKNEILDPFKKSYPWFFKLDPHGRPFSPPRPKTFMDVIASESILNP